MSKPKVLVILGSIRPGRNGKAVADWYMSHANNYADLDIELVDLVDWDLPFLDEAMPPSMGQYEKEHTKQWAEKIGSADGYVWITAEYNHGVPASLKNALDFVYGEWNRKPVAMVSYGSAGHGYRAAEHLRLTAAEMHMASIRTQVGINLFGGALQEDGSIDESKVDGDPVAQLDDLTWWVNALKTAREQ